MVALPSVIGDPIEVSDVLTCRRISLRELHTSPLWAACRRFALAAAILLVVMTLRRGPWPRGRELTGALLYGVLVFGGAYAFIFYALLELQAGFFQLTGALPDALFQ